MENLIDRLISDRGELYIKGEDKMGDDLYDAIKALKAYREKEQLMREIAIRNCAEILKAVADTF